MSTRQETPRRVLGKGLQALLPARPVQATAEIVTELPTDQIEPNPNQPRRRFAQQALEELARSIQLDGIVQPLVVRPFHGKHQIVAGERRWRAAQIAGLDRVPVVVREVPDSRLLEIALIENIQREDLNPVELAMAFQRMSAELGLSHDEIGDRTGKDRVTVTNSIRLLTLPEDLLELIAQRRLSSGHARALMKLATPEKQREVAAQAVAEGWSVRQIEMLTQESPPKKTRRSLHSGQSDPNIRAAVEELERALGTRVRIHEKGKGRGQVEIEYYSAEDLDRIYSAIVRDAES